MTDEQFTRICDAIRALAPSRVGDTDLDPNEEENLVRAIERVASKIDDSDATYSVGSAISKRSEDSLAASVCRLADAVESAGEEIASAIRESDGPPTSRPAPRVKRSLLTRNMEL